MPTLPYLTTRAPHLQTAPLYCQVEDYLRDQISQGALRHGDKLPTVKVLCEQFGGISHLTVRRAIYNLMKDQWVRTHPGSGTFVTKQPHWHRLVAIVLPEIDHEISRAIAMAAQRTLHLAGFRSLILDSRGRPSTEAGHLRSLAFLPIDGAIVFPLTNDSNSESISKLKRENPGFISMEWHADPISAPGQNSLGTKAATQLLTQIGYQPNLPGN